MKQRLLIVVGGCLVLVALGLPMLGVQRFEGDLEPVLLAFVAMAAALGCFVARFRPTLFEHYVEAAAAVFTVLALISMVGVLSHTSPNALMTAGFPGGPLPF